MYKHKTPASKNTINRFEDENNNFQNRFADDYEQETAEQDDKEPKGQAVTKGAIQKVGWAASKAAAQNTLPKTINISRGVLQFVSEGDLRGGDYDARYPHYPVDIMLVQQLTEEEKKTYPTSKRYTFNDLGLAYKSETGNYKRVEGRNRHKTESYTNVASNQKVVSDGTSNSGTTIGFGLDLGTKFDSSTEAEKFLKDKGKIDATKALTLSSAAGIKGVNAGKKAAELRSKVVLTKEETLSLLNAALPDYDKNEGYTKGDGTYHPAVEEVINNAKYAGDQAVKKKIINAAKGKKQEEQLAAVKEALEGKSNRLERKLYAYIEIIIEMQDAGYTLKFSDKVESLETLTSESDGTFDLVRSVKERRDKFKESKDLKSQFSDGKTKLDSIISASVGDGGKNIEADIKAVQKLLYNGDYDIDVNGIYDEKTKAAIAKFIKVNKTGGKVIKPDSYGLRVLRTYTYKTRTIKE